MDNLITLLRSVEGGEINVSMAELQILNMFASKLNIPTEEEVDRKSYNSFKETTKNFKGDLVSYQLGYHECWLWIMSKKEKQDEQDTTK